MLEAEVLHVCARRPDELEVALDPDFVETVREHLADLGFEHVTLDLHGYQTGSVSPASEESADEDEPLVEDVFDTDYSALRSE